MCLANCHSLTFFLLVWHRLSFGVAAGNKQHNTYSYTMTGLFNLTFRPYYISMTFYNGEERRNKYVTHLNYPEPVLNSASVPETWPKLCLLIPHLLTRSANILPDAQNFNKCMNWFAVVIFYVIWTFSFYGMYWKHTFYLLF